MTFKLSYSNADLYLGLAIELIEKDTALATSIAEKSLGSAVYPKTLAFLERLRHKDSLMADRFLSSAMQSILWRKGNDVNELFLLYSYVFSSQQVPVVVSEGLRTYEIPEYRSIAQTRPVESVLAKQFLQISAQIILNPDRLKTGIQQLVTGVAGDLYFLKVIEPLVSIYLPSQVNSLAAQRALLLQYLAQNQRELLQASLDRWNTSSNETRAESKDSSTLEDQIRRADEMADSDQKDQIYYMYYDKLTFSEVVRQQDQKDFYSTLSALQNLKNRIPSIPSV